MLYSVDTIKQLLKTIPSENDTIWYTVNPSQILGETNFKLLGVAIQKPAKYKVGPFNPYGEYILPPVITNRIKKLRIPSTKIFAWLRKKVPNADTISVLKTELDLLDSLSKIFNIPEEWMIVEFERQFGKLSFTPSKYDSIITYSIKKGYKFRFWEIKNETYHTKSPEEVALHLKKVVPVIKENMPAALTGLVISSKGFKWNFRVLKLAKGYYDFVIPHYYARLSPWEFPFEDIVASQNFIIFYRILKNNSILKKINPNRKIFHIDGEWAMNSRDPNNLKPAYTLRNGNIYGTIHRAYRLIFYLRENLLDAACAWNLLNLYIRRNKPCQGFAMLYPDMPEVTSMFYWLFKLFRQYTGKFIVDIHGKIPFYQSDKISVDNLKSFPLTPAIATYTPDSSLVMIVLVNASKNKSFPSFITLDTNQIIDSLSAVLLSDFRASPWDSLPTISDSSKVIKSINANILNNGKIINFISPPHSVIFLKISLRG